MNLFKPEHEKGILIETWTFENCPFNEFKLYYYDDCFILWRYVPKSDYWKKEVYIEVFRIEESPKKWAEKHIDEYRGINDRSESENSC